MSKLAYLVEIPKVPKVGKGNDTLKGGGGAEIKDPGNFIL